MFKISKNLILTGSLLSTFLTFIGCASSSSTSVSKTNCASMDWFEYGRRDGSRGAPKEQIEQYKGICGSEFNSQSEILYVNGRNSGLVEYCTPQNGYEVGKMGGTYLYVCPSLVEPAFISEMRRGQRYRDGSERARANAADKEPASEKAN